ncbi:MAG: Ig-like domain-containing protein [Planctomycetes bacterium]|nr:Ig-like domain-containing protein [Planctomycetota bacterium]
MLLAAAAEDTLPEGSWTRVLVLAVGPDGRGVPGDRLVAEARPGTASEPRELAPGAWTLRYTAPPAGAGGRGHLFLGLEGRGVRASLAFGVLPGIEMSAEPPSLVLGEGEGAVVRVRLPGELGPGGLRLRADEGETMGPLGPAGPGLWQAFYRPPAGGPPRLDLLRVEDVSHPGPERGRLALPLYARNEVVVETEPGAEVLVRVGPREYRGLAGEDGVARVPVIVGPMEEPLVLSRDEAGGPREERLRLDLPVAHRARLQSQPTAVVADGAQTARLALDLADDRGEALEGREVRFRLAEGEGLLGPAVERPGGRYECLYTAPYGVGVGRVRVVAEAGPSHRAEARIGLVAGPAAVLRGVGPAPRLRPGDPSAVEILLEVRDAAGNPVEGGLLSLEASQGSAGPVEARGGGLHAVRYTPPARPLEGRVRLVPELAAREFGAPADLLLAALPGSGSEGARLAVLARDAAGRPVAGYPLHLSVGGHVVEEGRTGADGVVVAALPAGGPAPALVSVETRPELAGDLVTRGLVPRGMDPDWLAGLAATGGLAGCGLSLAPAGVPPWAQARALRGGHGAPEPLELELELGPPARLDLEATPARVVAGPEARVLVRARVWDAAGDPAVVPTPPETSAGDEALGPMRERAPGVYEAEWRPAAGRPPGRVVFTARMAGSGLEALAEVEVVAATPAEAGVPEGGPAVGPVPGPGPVGPAPRGPAALGLEAEPVSWVAGETASVRLTAWVLDGMGAPVEDGTQVRFSLGGAVVEAATAGGLARAEAAAPTRAGGAEAQAVAGTARGRAALQVLPGAPATLELAVTPARLEVGREAEVEARPVDRFGNPAADGTPVELSADLGEAPGSLAVAGGRALGRYRALSVGTAHLEARSGTASGRATVEVVALPPRQVVVTASPSALVANGVARSQVEATVRDALGNPVEGERMDFAVSAGGGTVSPAYTVTDRLGVARVTYTASTRSGVRAIAATSRRAPDVRGEARLAEVAGPVDPARSSVLVAPATRVADGVEEAVVTVTLRDAFDNPVSGRSVQVSVSGGAHSVVQPPLPTGADGQALSRVRSTRAEVKTVSATDATTGLVLSAQPQVGFVAGPVSASRSSASVSPATATADGVAAVTLTVVLRDAQDNAIAGHQLTVELPGAGNSIDGTPGNGPLPLASLSSAAGTASAALRGTVAGVRAVTVRDATAGVVLGAAPGYELVAAAADATLSTLTSAPAGNLAADGSSAFTITVTLRDALGNPVRGHQVSLAATGTGNALAGAAGGGPTLLAGTTDASGTLSGAYTSTVAEAKTVTARDETEGRTLSRTLTLGFVPGGFSPSQSTVTASPATGVLADSVQASTVTVTLRDARSNPIPGRQVSLEVTGTGNQVASTLGNGPVTLAGFTDGAGRIEGRLRSTVAEAKTVTAREVATGTALATTPTVGFVALDRLAFASVAAPVQAGQTSGEFVVEARDALGNPVVQGAPRPVSLSTTSAGPATFLPSASLTIPAGASQARFRYSDRRAGTFTLTAGTAGATSGTASYTVAPGTVDAAASTVSASPANNVPADGVTASSVTVVLRDALGNPVPGRTVTLAAPGAIVTQPATVTDAAGSAAGTVARGSAGTATVGATDTTDAVALAAQAQVRFVGAANTVDHLHLSASPGASVAGQASGVFTVTAHTAAHAAVNVDAELPVSLSTTSPGAAAAFLPTSTVAIPAGQSQASLRYRDERAGAYTLSGSAPGVAGATVGAAHTVAASGVSAARSSVAASPSANLAADGVAASTLTVTVRDGFDNPVSGQAVVLSTTGGTPTQPGGATDVAGRATGSLKSGTAGLFTVGATGGGVALAAQVPVRFVAASDPVDHLHLVAPGAVAAGVASGAFTLAAHDAAHAPVVLANDLVASLASTSTGRVSFSPGATVTLPAGGSSTSFTATDTLAGSPLISATSASVSGATVGATLVVVPAAVDPERSTVEASPAGNVPADGSAFATLAVTLRDAFGNAVAGKDVALSAAGGSLVQPTVATDAAGGTSGAVRSGVPGRLSVFARDLPDGVDLRSPADVSFVSTAVDHLHLVTVPAAITAGQTSGAFTLELHGAGHAPVAATGAALQVSLSTDSGGAAAAFTPASLRIETGQSSGSFTYTDRKAGGFTLAASAGGLASATTPYTVSPGAVDAVASSTAASPRANVVANGLDEATVTVVLRDAFSNPVPGRPVTLTTGGATDRIEGVAANAEVAVGTTDAGGRVAARLRSTTTGDKTVTARDSTAGLTVTSTAVAGFVAGGGGEVDHLHLTVVPASVTAGATSGPFTVELHDAAHLSPAFSPDATIRVRPSSTSTGSGKAFVPAELALQFVSSGSFTYADNLAGRFEVAVAADGIAGATVAYTVDPGALDRFAVTGATQVLAGTATSLRLRALDAQGNTVTTFNQPAAISQGGAAAGGNVRYAGAGVGDALDGTATLAGTAWSGGEALVRVTDTAVEGPVTITATASGRTGGLAVRWSSAPAVRLEVSGVTDPLNRGAATGLTVTARTATGATASDYAGTVRFRSDDAGATLPPDTALVGGVATLATGLSFATAGEKSLTATDRDDAGLSGVRDGITVVESSAYRLELSGVADPYALGSASDLTVTARTISGTVAAGYAGTVRLSSSDPAATLPADYAFVPADAGRHTFSGGLVLRTEGERSVTATDLSGAALAGTISGVTVTGPAQRVVVRSASEAAPFKTDSVVVTVEVQDSSGNPQASHPAYAATVSASGSGAVAGGPVSLASGVASATVTVTNNGSTEAVTVSLSETSATALLEVSGTVQFTSDPPRAIMDLDREVACLGDPVEASGDRSWTEAPAVLVSYLWDLDADGAVDHDGPTPPPVRFTRPGIHPVRLTVVDSLGWAHSATRTVHVGSRGEDPAGPIRLVAAPAAIPADGVAESALVAGPLTDCQGRPVLDGHAYTVAATLGTVLAPDADPARPGVQVPSAGGQLRFGLRSGRRAGTARVWVESVEGAAAGGAAVELRGDGVMPVVVAFGPGGHLEEAPLELWAEFSEPLDAGRVDLSSVVLTGSLSGAVGGELGYDPARSRVTLRPGAALDVGAEVYTLTLRHTLADPDGNPLDGDLDGLPSGPADDFSFLLGAVPDVLAPRVVGLSVAPSPFSPDGDGRSDTTLVSLGVEDDGVVRAARVVVGRAGRRVRTLTGRPSADGSAVLVWDGRDESGGTVEPGAYDLEAVAQDAWSNLSPPARSTVTVEGAIRFGRYGP